MAFLDTLKSLVTGLGTSKDKSVSQVFDFRQMTDLELNAMHRSDWLARKIVDIIPNDMTREGREWQADKDQIEIIEKVEKAPLINLMPKLNLAMRKARLLRGAAIYMGMKDRTPDKELDIERVGKGDLLYLNVVGRHNMTVGEAVQDVTSEYFGQPSYYEVRSANGTSVKVHPSRMIRFIGADILDDQYSINDGWGDSILQIAYDAVMNASSVQQHVAALIPEAKTDVIYIPGLSGFLANPTTTQRLTDRFTYANTIKSMFNMVLLEGNGADDGEKWEQKQINFAQLPELMQVFLQVASGAADIPVTRLLGQSPSGMNATGDSDIRNYYDNISARQRQELAPALHRLDEVIIRSALGKRDEAIYYKWAPLWGMSEKEKADVFKTKADAARTIAGTGGMSPPLMPIEALSDALVNELIEDGSLSGLDAAMDKYGLLSEQADNPDDITAALGANVAPTPPPANAKQAATDAAPRSLYVSRKLLNGADVIAWAKGQGLDTTLPADDLHTTITYSRLPVDWFEMGSTWDETMTVPAGGARMLERFGEATVLLFSSNMLKWRHDEMVERGATWDHPEYQPHVTISYGFKGDLEKVEPYQGELVFGPELFAEVKEDWAKGLSDGP